MKLADLVKQNTGNRKQKNVKVGNPRSMPTLDVAKLKNKLYGGK